MDLEGKEEKAIRRLKKSIYSTQQSGKATSLNLPLYGQ
jgi:hypothetical protein